MTDSRSIGVTGLLLLLVWHFLLKHVHFKGRQMGARREAGSDRLQQRRIFQKCGAHIKLLEGLPENGEAYLEFTLHLLNGNGGKRSGPDQVCDTSKCRARRIVSVCTSELSRGDGDDDQMALGRAVG